MARDRDFDLIPEVATHKGICGDWRCMQEIVRGEVIVRYPDNPDKPHHVRHWLDRFRGDLGKAQIERDRYKTVADEVLAFCSGLSAVSAEWIGRQYQAMRGQY